MADIPDPLRLHFHLLDRQIVDADGEPVGKVDDVELDRSSSGLHVVALLSGQRVLGRRIGGRFGRWLEAVGRRLLADPGTGPLRIPVGFVTGVDSAVHLSLRRETLRRPPLEQWLGDHLIDRLPGADDAGQ